MYMPKLFHQYDDEISYFWLTNYDLKMQPIYCLPFLMCSKQSCPGYLPYVKEGICRLCSYNSKTHRKYYIYSYYARKIQRLAIKYLYKQFVKHHLSIYQNNIVPYATLYYKIYYKYYRNWNRLYEGIIIN